MAKKAIQQIEGRDAVKEPPQKVIRINTVLTHSEESRLTSKEKKMKIKQATVISQVLTNCPAIEDGHVIDFLKKDLRHRDQYPIKFGGPVDGNRGQDQQINQVIDRLQWSNHNHYRNVKARCLLPTSGILGRPWFGKINVITSALGERCQPDQ
ncbi:unnamed protein product [Prunus brigantina]